VVVMEHHSTYFHKISSSADILPPSTVSDATLATVVNRVIEVVVDVEDETNKSVASSWYVFT
jgi:hypothetical protein